MHACTPRVLYFFAHYSWGYSYFLLVLCVVCPPKTGLQFALKGLLTLVEEQSRFGDSPVKCLGDCGTKMG